MIFKLPTAIFFTSKERGSEKERKRENVCVCVCVFTYSSVLFHFSLNSLAIYVLCIGCDPQGHYTFMLSHHSCR
jgi:hypothetical protein